MSLGQGGQLLAQKQLEWDKKTIRKGIKELISTIRRRYTYIRFLSLAVSQIFVAFNGLLTSAKLY